MKIGAIYPRTGIDRSSGKDTLHGVELAVDYLNKGGFPQGDLPLAGGAGLPNLGGAKIKLVPEDSGSDCHLAKGLFTGLATGDRVAAVIGAYESTVTLQALNAADQQHVPFVSESSTAQSFTRADGRRKPPRKACKEEPKQDRTPSRWFFRVSPHEEQAAGVFRRFLLDERKRGITVEKAAILYEDADIYGESAFAATKDIAGKLNVDLRPYPYRTVLGPRKASSGSSCPDDERELDERLRSRIDAIWRFRPEVVFAASYSADAVATVQTMTKKLADPEQGTSSYAPQALLAYGAGYEGPGFIERTQAGRPGCHLPPGNPNGIITRLSSSPNIKHQTETMTTVRKAFKDAYRTDMTDNSARGFTAMIALAKAIDDAGPGNRANISRYRTDIRDALRGLHLTSDQTIMPWGVRFDKYGQNELARVLLEQKRATGNVVVYPKGLKTDDAIWPLSWVPSP